MIVENIFESRFKHIDEIRRMGANVTIDDRVAVVEGVEKLTGAPVRASDLRAGAALIVAGLMADSVTEITNIKYIDRGYDHIERSSSPWGRISPACRTRIRRTTRNCISIFPNKGAAAQRLGRRGRRKHGTDV